MIIRENQMSKCYVDFQYDISMRFLKIFIFFCNEGKYGSFNKTTERGYILNLMNRNSIFTLKNINIYACCTGI